ncbi:MAG: cytochrome c biogenesis protein, partial [Planctomycetota bacterium]
VKTRGIAVLSIFGNIVTAWSWFGVNQLGVGLHSYGFTDSVTFWLLIFVATQLAVMAIGMLPRGMWRSAVTIDGPKRKAAEPGLAGGGGAQPAGGAMSPEDA